MTAEWVSMRKKNPVNNIAGFTTIWGFTLEKEPVLVVIITFYVALASRLSLSDSQKDYQDHNFLYNCYTCIFYSIEMNF